MGKLVEIKTKENDASVEDFIRSIPDQQKQNDSFVILKMMEKVTKTKAKMWGKSIIGFGNIRYKSPKTGREVDWMQIGFSPRKANLSLYIGIKNNMNTALLRKLGKHKTGVGCLYINKLSDVDLKILESMIRNSVKK